MKQSAKTCIWISRLKHECKANSFQLTLKKLQFLYFIGMGSFPVIRLGNFWTRPLTGSFFLPNFTLRGRPKSASDRVLGVLLSVWPYWRGGFQLAHGFVFLLSKQNATSFLRRDVTVSKNREGACLLENTQRAPKQ